MKKLFDVSYAPNNYSDTRKTVRIVARDTVQAAETARKKYIGKYGSGRVTAVEEQYAVDVAK